MAIPLQIDYRVEPNPEKNFFFKWVVVRQRSMWISERLDSVGITTEVVSRHFTHRGARNRCLGMNQWYSR